MVLVDEMVAERRRLEEEAVADFDEEAVTREEDDGIARIQIPLFYG